MRSLILALAMSGLLSMAVRRPMVGVIAFEWISFMSPAARSLGRDAGQSTLGAARGRSDHYRLLNIR